MKCIWGMKKDCILYSTEKYNFSAQLRAMIISMVALVPMEMREWGKEDDIVTWSLSKVSLRWALTGEK